MAEEISIGPLTVQFLCSKYAMNGRLDLFDIVFEFGDHGRIPTDNLVENGPQHRVGAEFEQLRMLFEAASRSTQFAGNSLTHRNHEIRTDKNADLAEVDFLAGVVIASGAKNDQFHIRLEVLDLRPQVKSAGILDGQLVQAERVPDPVHLFASRLEHPEPHESPL